MILVSNVKTSHEWTGPPAQRTPQPQQDSENPGHYFNVFETPRTDSEDKIRTVDDCQPRVVISSLYKNGKISLDDTDIIKETAAKLAINEALVVSCITHLRDLEANRKRREQEKMRNKEKIANNTFEDDNWLELVLSGKINKLLVVELNKYIEYHKLNMKCSKKDKIRAITVNVLKQESMEKQKDTMRQVSGQVEYDDYLLDNAVLSSDDSDYEHTWESEARGSNNVVNNDDESDDDDFDLVFKDLDEESDNFSQSGLIVTTRSGRNARSWKLAFTD